MATAQLHLRGVKAMIDDSGGPGSIGLTVLVKRMYHQVVRDADMVDIAKCRSLHLVWGTLEIPDPSGLPPIQEQTV